MDAQSSCKEMCSPTRAECEASSSSPSQPINDAPAAMCPPVCATLGVGEVCVLLSKRTRRVFLFAGGAGEHSAGEGGSLPPSPPPPFIAPSGATLRSMLTSNFFDR
jgi:hypothetical protein